METKQREIERVTDRERVVTYTNNNNNTDK